MKDKDRPGLRDEERAKIGQKRGMLTAIRELPHRRIECLCDCGNTKIIRFGEWAFPTNNCGCVLPDKYGWSKTRLHGIWGGIRNRCKARSRSAPRYYNRGIRMCHEWKYDFYKFRDWALQNGYTDDLQIDRIDNNGIYEPSNCRFVTAKENVNNQERTIRVEYNGEIRALKPLYDSLPIKQSYGTVLKWIKDGKGIDYVLERNGLTQ